MLSIELERLRLTADVVPSMVEAGVLGGASRQGLSLLRASRPSSATSAAASRVRVVGTGAAPGLDCDGFGSGVTACRSESLP